MKKTSKIYAKLMDQITSKKFTARELMHIYEMEMINSNGANEARKRIIMAFETGRNPVSIKTACKTINKLDSQNEILKYYHNSNDIPLNYSISSPSPPLMPTVLPNMFKKEAPSSFRLNKASLFSIKKDPPKSEINPFNSSLSEVPFSQQS